MQLVIAKFVALTSENEAIVVNPTMSLKNMVTISYFSGLTYIPERRHLAIGLNVKSGVRRLGATTRRSVRTLATLGIEGLHF